MNNCFCTLFDHRYLDRGLALYESIERYCDCFQLWVLCMDDTCFEVLDAMNLQSMHLVKLGELEEEDPPLKKVKPQRTSVEYYFNCKPSLALYILKKSETATQVTYMDADIFFFASPEIIYDKLEGKSVAITPHHFAPEKKHLEKFGKFNAGWLLFKRDENGLACLRWWRERCIEWCHDYIESDRFADQKYINRFASLFKGVWSVDNVGVNLAPWNISGKTISQQDKNIYIDGERLIFYHFHNLRSVTKRVFDLGCKDYTLVLDNKVRHYIYKPYLAALLRHQAALPFAEAPLERGGQKISCEEKNCQENLVNRCIKKINFMIMLGRGLKEGKYMIGRKGASLMCEKSTVRR
ncbi:MAG: glycosyl transferase [Candidatus Electrothrix sp. GM3_4]|nr:glycosyl transferase [Candidatus Electrothrix sp. GM3_4]